MFAHQELIGFGAGGDFDQYFANVTLLLEFEGSNGSTTFTDLSNSAKSTSSVSGTAQISTAQFKYGASSANFDGNGDYITYATSTDWDMTGDFTVEMFLRAVTLGRENCFLIREDGGGTAELLLRIDTSNAFDCFIRTGSGGGTIIGRLQPASGFATNTWYHVAYVRSGNNFYLFKDGVQQATTTSASAGQSGSGLALRVGGRASTLSEGFAGYIDGLRITKGVARYTAGFTVPSSAYPRG